MTTKQPVRTKEEWPGRKHLTDVEKRALAAAIRNQTTASLLRLAKHLHMRTTGYASMQTRRHLNAHGIFRK